MDTVFGGRMETQHPPAVAGTRIVTSHTPLSRLSKSRLVTPHDTMDAAARRVMRYYVLQMVNHEKGVLNGGDIDDLHDMRVAVRRLRVACRLFHKTLGKKRLEPFVRRLRQLGQDLGGVRDLDVFIAFVEDYGKACQGADGIGIEALRAHLEQQREAPYAHLLTQLQGKRYAKFKDEFQAWLADASSPRKAGKRPVTQEAPRLLDRYREGVLAYADRIDAHAAPETLHALRIDCKRFRYTAEFFKGCYGRRIDWLIKRMTAFQDMLGRHHDADVHIATVSEYIAGLDRRSSRQRRIQAELEDLIASEREAQRACFDSFWPLWPPTLEKMRGFNFTLMG